MLRHSCLSFLPHLFLGHMPSAWALFWTPVTFQDNPTRPRCGVFSKLFAPRKQFAPSLHSQLFHVLQGSAQGLQFRGAISKIQGPTLLFPIVSPLVQHDSSLFIRPHLCLISFVPFRQELCPYIYYLFTVVILVSSTVSGTQKPSH